ncbi:SPFH domain-containing protein [Rhodococcoides yunnanense]|uniref:SPFH domain-containing protein n=1 Tax=Rhodococcoides yunnanense TaxID=278209 RepID=UPI0035300751
MPESAPVSVSEKPTGTPTLTIAERPGWDLPGWSMLGIGLVLLLSGGGAFALGLVNDTIALTVSGVVLFLLSFPLLAGLTLVQPNQARVLQLLGSSYSGTLRTPGLRWTNPLTLRRAISTRIRNHETGQSKVNDADGNPIEISAIIVWQVADTALASFQVDDYEEFVAVQSESAVRHIAGSYPYDAADRMSLRENADEITRAMSEEVHARVRSAGVEVIETRINRLAYSPEIAQAMLRRQQAGAVIAAREQIVEGAVGMVEMALSKLEENHVVELDEERKATMVSNLLVVLCSDNDTQPVINTGSLYQ